MANRTQLYNSTLQTCNPRELEDSVEQAGGEYIECAGSLSLPYLSISAEEVALMGDDHEEYSENIRRAFSGNLDAVGDLKDLSAYDDRVAPYSLEEFDAIKGKRDEDRNSNSIALYSGIFIEPAESA
ncbi:hypothetical protein [Massilia antarctica]|uniref:hypothetical protein n=1 Tax=Massilia antarctica TaxID=2765360 RepID=UPI00226FBE79|nr:hypothetical protein [Massilia sp. H27-R4]MCY0910391.1 hypothetical protein [Massilia sp. H27-R4]